MKNKTLIVLMIGLTAWITFPAASFAQKGSLMFDPAITPFSYRGAYTCFSQYIGRGNPPKTLTLHQVSRRGKRIDYFEVEVIRDGKVVESDIVATPEKLTLNASGGSVEICYASPRVIRFRGNGLGFRLSVKMKHYLVPLDDRRFRFFSRESSERFMLAELAGNSVMDQVKVKDEKHPYQYVSFQYDMEPDDSGVCELALEEYLVEWEPKSYEKPFDACVGGAARIFETWCATRPFSPAEYDETTRLAMYLNWSSLVEPRGWIGREGMLMSKTWMNGIWSWDNCFNAIATSMTDRELAWDQLMVVFDNQQSCGALPDGTFENNLGLSFRKPPIYGWTLMEMEKIAGPLDRTNVEEIYPLLADFTEYWFNFRDDDGDGIPEYHHGNDSGWDNGTVFDMGFPVESPDLAAFLVIQMEYLSDLATRLGRRSEAAAWTSRSAYLLKKMVDELWNGEKFLHVRTIDGTYNEASMCALSYMPLVLGTRLPEKIRGQMLADLKRDYITGHGIATESPKSTLYKPDGYWRGPIWAPETYLILSGLDNMGEAALVRQLVLAFCELCKRGGFAENFDAITGKALVDPAYTWTSSTYLALVKEYLANQ